MKKWRNNFEKKTFSFNKSNYRIYAWEDVCVFFNLMATPNQNLLDVFCVIRWLLWSFWICCTFCWCNEHFSYISTTVIPQSLFCLRYSHRWTKVFYLLLFVFFFYNLSFTFINLVLHMPLKCHDFSIA